MSTKTYKHNSGLIYETTERPFFGPKMRAIEALKQHIGSIVSSDEFITYLQKNYIEYFSNHCCPIKI
jgi:hypothetical protein